jgi:hypothetical protein
VVLFDLREFRKQGVLRKWRDLRVEHDVRPVYKLAGQAELQIILNHSIKPLPSAWNRCTDVGDGRSTDVEHSPQPLGKKRVEEATRNTSHAKILHYCGRFKPWRSRPTGPLQIHWTARAVAGGIWWNAVLPITHHMDRCSIKLAHSALGNVSWANAPVRPAPRFVIYCRVRRESPYLQFFIDWHVRLGFERIIVLMQDEDRGAYKRFSADPKVMLLWVDRTEPDSLPRKYLPRVLDLDP